MSSDTVQYVIQCQHLGWVDDNLISELVTFLEGRIGKQGTIARSGKKISIETLSTELNKRNLKTYLKKFLHRFELKEKLRIITGVEANSYLIHKRPGYTVTDF